jgi:transglutaminase-like putative cysteine protease
MSAVLPRRMLPRWPGWQRLPREARDTLFLLAVIAWTVMPHFAHLPGWTIGLSALVLVWRALLAVESGPLPSRWALLGVLVVAVALTYWSFGGLLGKEPGVTLTVTLMALKTLELRARRDAFVIFFLGFFIILTHFLYSQSLAVAVAMLISIWGLLTALVLAHMPVGQPSLRQASGLAARTALLGAPVMALLFALFPRVGPLWGVPQDGISTTGLSNTMRMGSVSELARDEAVAMRIRFEGTRPFPSQMYFRGPVLTRFDGFEWRPLGMPLAPPGTPERRPALRPIGNAIRFEATFEPLRVASLPLLEATVELEPIEGLRLSRREDLQWLAERPIYERIRVKGLAYPRYELGTVRRASELQESLELPVGFNPRTLAWARSLHAEPAHRNVDATGFAALVMRHIREGGYDYTLAPTHYGRDAVDEFWLDGKDGFCEHFAAAFVVVMRAAGFPARVVTGYQGADSEPVDGYFIVRQSSAHAWAEYWQNGQGWIRADPTGAVAPDRIGRSTRLEAQPGLVAGVIAAMSPELFASLRRGWEAINNRWNQWVLNYSRNQQADVLKNLGFTRTDWDDLALLLIGVLSGLAFAGAAWAWLDRHRVDPWVRQLERLKRGLRSLGIAAAPHEAPRTLAARVRECLGERGEPLAAALDALELQRYGPVPARRPDAGLTRRFAADSRRLRGSLAR